MREQLIRLDPEAVNTVRLRRGWTWADLAREAGMSPPTRAKVTNGQPISIRTARRVCKVLRMSLRSTLLDVGHGDAASAANSARPTTETHAVFDPGAGPDSVEQTREDDERNGD